MSLGDEEIRRLVMRSGGKDRPECAHVSGPTSTLITTYHAGTGLWFVSCTKCKRWTEPCLTQPEASERAKAGWWAV